MQVEAADMELSNRVHTMRARTDRGAWASTEADKPLAGVPASEVEQVRVWLWCRAHQPTLCA